MIKFVMVDPSIDLQDIASYFDLLVNNLNLETPLVNSCTAYEKEELTCKIKIETNTGLYFVELEFATFNKSRHLFISVFPQRMDINFDKDLYAIKFKIKDLLRKDWEECIWLLDEQSTTYANELYLDIHKLENNLRQFINIVMIRHFGVNWWITYAPKKIKDKYQARFGAYKRVAKLYANVSDKLLSIDTDDLMSIMTHKIEKFSDNNGPLIIGLLDSLKETGDISTVAADYKRIIRELKQNCEVELDLWAEIFTKYFPEAFIKQWEEFSKNRNHVAHNKLLDSDAFKTIKASISAVENTLTSAQEKFDQVSISDEEKERILELEAMRDIEYELLELSRKEEESGIRILDENSIFEEFDQAITNEIENLADNLYFRNDLEISTSSLTHANQDVVLLKIKSKLNENVLKIISSLEINEESGSESILSLSLNLNGDIVDECTLTYQNGDAALDKEHNYYMPLHQNELHDEELLEFINGFENETESAFPNLVNEVHAIDYDVKRDGGNSIVAEFPCEECGEEYVCINNEIAEKGQCVNCGHIQSINECERCETYYNDGLEGNSYLCESCLDWIDAQ